MLIQGNLSFDSRRYQPYAVPAYISLVEARIVRSTRTVDSQQVIAQFIWGDLIEWPSHAFGIVDAFKTIH